jgi:hypothetical protein
MIAMELAQTAWTTATSTFDALIAVLPAVEEPAPKGNIATTNILEFLASKIAPIMLAVLGVIFIGRASKGEVSKVLTSSAIAIMGLAFIAGAATLFLVGESLIGLMFE